MRMRRTYCVFPRVRAAAAEHGGALPDVSAGWPILCRAKRGCHAFAVDFRRVFSNTTRDIQFIRTGSELVLEATATFLEMTHRDWLADTANNLSGSSCCPVGAAHRPGHLLPPPPRQYLPSRATGPVHDHRDSLH
jgi:hypothetical protein